MGSKASKTSSVKMVSDVSGGIFYNITLYEETHLTLKRKYEK